MTERYLSRDPAGVLDAIVVARAEGVGIAIDDVGADPTSLAMMPLVRPDVIKLDLSLIQSRPDQDVARTVNGVLALHPASAPLLGRTEPSTSPIVPGRGALLCLRHAHASSLTERPGLKPYKAWTTRTSPSSNRPVPDRGRSGFVGL